MGRGEVQVEGLGAAPGAGWVVVPEAGWAVAQAAGWVAVPGAGCTLNVECSATSLKHSKMQV